MIYGVLLVLFLGPLGLIIAICFKDPDYIKGAVITLIIEAIVTVVALFIVMVVVRGKMGFIYPPLF